MSIRLDNPIVTLSIIVYAKDDIEVAYKDETKTVAFRHGTFPEVDKAIAYIISSINWEKPL